MAIAMALTTTAFSLSLLLLKILNQSNANINKNQLHMDTKIWLKYMQEYHCIGLRIKSQIVSKVLSNFHLLKVFNWLGSVWEFKGKVFSLAIQFSG